MDLARNRAGRRGAAWRQRAPVLLLVAGALWSHGAMGCSGGYAESTRAFRQSVVANDFEAAEIHIDGLVAEASAAGSALETDYPLLLLERSTVSMVQRDYVQTTVDLNEADGLLEILDLTPEGAEQLGQYLWSDSVGLYRPPMYEKLLVNLIKVAAYLAMGNYSGARVEARRLNVLVSYYEDSPLTGHPMLATSYQLAGLAMELSGEVDQALRFYFDAWSREPTEPLAESIARLGQASALGRRSEVREAREVIGLEGDEALAVPEQEVVVLLFTGLAPRREAERFPIGLVWGWITGGGLTLGPLYYDTFVRLQAEQLLTWVNFPVLVPQPSAFDHFEVAIDGQGVVADELADIESFAVAQWEEERPVIAVAAVTRAIVRVLAREAVQAVGNAVTDSDGGRTAFFITSLILQAGMQAADVPDTRTWSTMAGRFWLARLPARPGLQSVELRASGPMGTLVERIEVDVPAGGSRVLALRIVP